jgi:hypothetical protein
VGWWCKPLPYPQILPRNEYMPKVGGHVTTAPGSTSRITTSSSSSDPQPATMWEGGTPVYSDRALRR